jgi:hypothetical protein
MKHEKSNNTDNLKLFLTHIHQKPVLLGRTYKCSINQSYTHKRNTKVPVFTRHSNHPQIIYYTMGVVTYRQKCSKT